MRPFDLFTEDQRRIVAELEARDRAERERGVRVPMSLKAVAPDVAELLCTLVLGRVAKTIVEFGTSHGYSTLHLAAAAERTRGHVYTVDLLPEKTALAASHLEAAGLGHRVTLTSGDGAEFAASLPQGVDFALIDYDLASFAPALDPLRQRLSPGALTFIDGGPPGYWQSESVRPFREKLDADPGLLVSALPMHKDHLLLVRLPD